VRRRELGVGHEGSEGTILHLSSGKRGALKMAVKMKWFIVRPEVSGGWGAETRVDTSVNPPKVYHLDYRFDDWLGDHLIESYPCFIVTDSLASALREAKLTGFETENISVSKSDLFLHAYGNGELPKFVRLVVNGRKDQDDFWLTEDQRLGISERALEILSRHGLKHADIRQLPDALR